jgi:adenylate cyclase
MSSQGPDNDDETELARLMPRETRVVLVCDVVESVRWMEQHEDEAITRWTSFAREVRERIAPAHGGIVVKSTGDGLMMEFNDAQRALVSARAMHAFCQAGNLGVVASRQMHLRVGLNSAGVRRDLYDLYGHGVNLAARVATLASPGEIIVTASVRDQLTDELDGDIEDLGECHLKNLSAPHRVYRVGPAHPSGLQGQESANLAESAPALAVLTLEPKGVGVDQEFYGELFADHVSNSLAQTASIQVLSRIAASSLSNRSLNVTEIAKLLKVKYLLTGSFTTFGQKMIAFLELSEAHSGKVIWAGRVVTDAGELCAPLCDAVSEVVAETAREIIDHELAQIYSQALPTLSSNSILLGAVHMMHRTSPEEFRHSRAMLEHLVERHRRASRPYAWLANWHALRVTQGFSHEPRNEAFLALELSKKALDADPSSSLALAIDGVLQLNLNRDAVVASQRLEAALGCNPNDSLAWLYKGLIHGVQGEATDALAASGRALDLLPIGPVRHYYDAIAASAALGARNYELAIGLATRSLRTNRLHASTYRVLAVAQELAGHHEAAQVTVTGLKKLLPDYTLRDFAESSPHCFGPNRELFIDAFKSAGLAD